MFLKAVPRFRWKCIVTVVEYTQEELLARSVGKLVSLKIIKKEDILFTDVRFEPYANVIFDHNIYEARKIVRDLSFFHLE